MSWLYDVVHLAPVGAPALSTLSALTVPALTAVLVPALVVTFALCVILRTRPRLVRAPGWCRALAFVGALSIGASAAVPGAIHLGLRALNEWVGSDEDRRRSIGGLLLLPAWWLYTDAGRNDESLLRLEGPDGTLTLSPFVESDFMTRVASRLDGDTVLSAIERGLSPPWSERRTVLPSSFQAIATTLVEAECAALADAYGALLRAVQAVSPPRALGSASLAVATWFVDTHVPDRAWTLGVRIILILLGAAALLFCPLLVAALARPPPNQGSEE